MSLIIDPLSLILITMHVPESALAMRLIEAPVTLIACTVLPDLHTMTVSVLALPLASVLGAILEDEFGTVLDGALIVALSSF